MSYELVEAVRIAICIAAGGNPNHEAYKDHDRRIARATIAVCTEWCADAVNGLAYGDAVAAIRKLGESE